MTMADYNVTLQVKRDTCARWALCKTAVPAKGQVIVYTDYGKRENEDGTVTDIPAIKIGDGNAYLVDLPFVGDDLRAEIEKAVAKYEQFQEHIRNQRIHVSDTDREKWDRKLSCRVEDETLEFTYVDQMQP